jgi:uncharacterized protein (DUF924 family)
MIYLDAKAKIVLDIWFREDIIREVKQNKISSLTKKILTTTLSNLYDQAILGEFDDWVDIPQESLALIILLFHFPRLVLQEYNHKEESILIVLHAIKYKYDYKITHKDHRFCLYFPLLLSDNESEQKIALAKFATINSDALLFAKNIIKHGVL